MRLLRRFARVGQGHEGVEADLPDDHWPLPCSQLSIVNVPLVIHSNNQNPQKSHPHAAKHSMDLYRSVEFLALKPVIDFTRAAKLKLILSHCNIRVETGVHSTWPRIRDRNSDYGLCVAPHSRVSGERAANSVTILCGLMSHIKKFRMHPLCNYVNYINRIFVIW